jgi:hypothetical protein
MAHPPHSPDLAPCDHWLFARVKEHLRDKRYESEYDINTVTDYLHRLGKDEYKAATDRLPHKRKNYMWTVLVMTLTTGNTCKHLGISVVLLTCILLLQ